MTIGRRQQGYTLVEVVMAFAILALALTLLLGTLSGGLKQVRWASDAARATQHARSLLDQTGVGEVLPIQRTEGVWEDGRYRWMLEVSPYREPGMPTVVAEENSPIMMRLHLTVLWGEGEAGERLEISSLRFVQPAVPGTSS